ncbi:T9SS type A sorting domain-containing protein [Crocinitomix catalasitica]|uniref:T9SS type A sorting domain-containing protein n=1 Tax=Crocinitomix catalasitica TaxID=184607 RepID=UPI00047F2B7B|nr:T9SS type A sorting domain-containing protein [Crocinitomix catalasitica]
MKKLLLNILMLGIANSLFAYLHIGDTRRVEIESRAAGCAPSNGRLFLEYNNVKALIEVGGSLWQNRATSTGSYNFPKDANTSVIFSGSLWMGGEDINGQLKLAAHRFRTNGNDFWGGPLGDLTLGSGNYNPFNPIEAESNLVKDNGAAEVYPATCVEFDQFFTIRRIEVEQFIAWWNCENGISDPEDCEDVIAPDEEVMGRILNWPAHGKESLGQDFYLAPFYDNDRDGDGGNGIYNPLEDGDYPWYDVDKKIDCRTDRRVTLFGDETHWWVFNDKGNIHTETGGDPIGMEIRAQAFAFATDDEINNMTFYNYELINRGTQTLFNTYFGQYVDPDVGGAGDDFVGCDVGRGLGYAYNGDLNDDAPLSGEPTYGANPPAVGVDFFEGPYQDNDGIANPIGIAENEALNGLGYGDDIVDNERFGMQGFMYYTNVGSANYNDPTIASQYYLYLQSIWKNSEVLKFGGNGNTSSSGVQTRFAFPGASDTLGWGTYPNPLPSADAWSEVSENNDPDDRRFVQSAGPFTLTPGAVNNITVGVVIGVSADSDIEAPLRSLFTADTKAQKLFESCFQILEPPVAPVLTVQELENELILFLSTPAGSPAIESYAQRDEVNIITPDELLAMGIVYDDTFRFEGYQIYQMIDESASVSDLNDVAKARLVAQTDVQNDVGEMVNYGRDEDNIPFGNIMVEAAPGGELDQGIRHSFRITEDLFAEGSRALVNHKKYYYIAVSYAYNNFKSYNPDDPAALDGQKAPYLRSRNAGTSGSIESVEAIPHDPSPEADGRVFTTSYGFQPEITQIEGIGNGGAFIELTDASVQNILTNNQIDHPVYKANAGPIDVRVVDPLNLKDGDYTIGFGKTAESIAEDEWWIQRVYTEDGATSRDTVFSNQVIGLLSEQLILDWGIAITVNQQYFTRFGVDLFTSPIDATITYQDSSKQWLAFVNDQDTYYPSNWIRVGTDDANSQNTDETPNALCTVENWIYAPCNYDDNGEMDAENQEYEKLLGGGIAPFRFVGYETYGMPFGKPGQDLSEPTYESSNGSEFFSSARIAQIKASLEELHDVDIVITQDKSKWTRCPVIEINNNPAVTEHDDYILEPRGDKSVDKNGLAEGDPGVNLEEANSVDATGMGWFPGYAIDVNTGTRLNMAFSENSWLLGENGNDMIWNPTSSYAEELGDNINDPLFGGMHYVYIFGVDVDGTDAPAYDQGAWLRDKLDLVKYEARSERNSNYRDAWTNCQWVMEPMLAEDEELLSTDVKISTRINIPYDERTVNGENEGFPMYQFNISNSSRVADSDKLVSVIDNIKIVPNPYYAYSAYETGKLDNRVKITNLPERCEVNIFNMQGALVRSYKKDDAITSLDWDLKNAKNIPIAGGIYLIHIKIEVNEDGGVKEYEKVLKWYGVMRQPDLDNL